MKPPKSNGLADPIQDSDKCPLCRKRIQSIIPLSQIVSEDKALDTIKYFNRVISNDLGDGEGDEDIIEILRQHKSTISQVLNELTHDTTLAPIPKKQRVIAYMMKHKLFFSLEGGLLGLSLA